MGINLNAIIRRNLQTAKETAHLKSTVGVFVGGTSGIGENTAYAFAKYTANPTVYIVGRNAEAGERILGKLKELNENVDARFLKHDLTLIKEADALSNKILSEQDKINLLFLSPGFLNVNGRNESAEGIDTKLSINYYSRWRIVDNLKELLSSAASAGESARVVSVLEPGYEGPVNLDDLDLKHNFSLSNAHRHAVEFNSLAVERFSKLYPQVSFIHASPGVVATSITRDFPWYIRYPLTLFKPLLTKPEDSAERFYYVGAGSPDYTKGGFLLKADLKEIKDEVASKGYLTPELQETVWKHSEALFKNALEKDAKSNSKQ